MGEYTIHLAGESFCQPACSRARPGDAVSFTPEPRNRYDSMAVRVDGADGKPLGYIPRDHWFQRIPHTNETDFAGRVRRVMGGGGPQPNYGIVLIVWTAGDVDRAAAWQPEA